MEINTADDVTKPTSHHHWSPVCGDMLQTNSSCGWQLHIVSATFKAPDTNPYQYATFLNPHSYSVVQYFSSKVYRFSANKEVSTLYGTGVFITFFTKFHNRVSWIESLKPPYLSRTCYYIFLLSVFCKGSVSLRFFLPWFYPTSYVPRISLLDLIVLIILGEERKVLGFS